MEAPFGRVRYPGLHAVEQRLVDQWFVIGLDHEAIRFRVALTEPAFSPLVVLDYAKIGAVAQQVRQGVT